MIRLHFRAADVENGRINTIEGAIGQSLMQAAVTAGVDGIPADCGGMLTCATCHVYIDANVADLPSADADEIEMLDFTAAPRRANSRLGCQIVLTEALDGLVVELPDRQY